MLNYGLIIAVQFKKGKLKMIFDELVIGEEFKYKERNWKKMSMFSATCLDRDSPFNPDTLVAFDRKDKVELKVTAADSIFKRRIK